MITERFRIPVLAGTRMLMATTIDRRWKRENGSPTKKVHLPHVSPVARKTWQPHQSQSFGCGEAEINAPVPGASMVSILSLELLAATQLRGGGGGCVCGAVSGMMVIVIPKPCTNLRTLTVEEVLRHATVWNTLGCHCHPTHIYIPPVSVRNVPVSEGCVCVCGTTGHSWNRKTFHSRLQTHRQTHTHTHRLTLVWVSFCGQRVVSAEAT